MRVDENLYAMAKKLGRAAMARGALICTAESCTGGLVAAAITAVAGSSDWFDRGFVTYSNQAKIDDLGVSPQTIERFGAVSVETAEEMARGARGAGRAHWAVAVTGIAGPAGGSPAKPVGTVCFAWAGPQELGSEIRLLEGDRTGIRQEAVRIALAGLIDRLA
ncbi:MAG TPA: CinA family protein [Casimicrobiaceae bacterium]|nr:CinA family protein [Casimicrobiaceae bacterium]